MEMILRIRLLGPIQIEKDGVALHEFGSRKALALLAYLARQDQPVSRNHLAALFWPDKAKGRGRRNLTRELSWLSAQLPGCFKTNYRTVRFTPTATCWLDTAAFETLLKNIEAAPASGRAAGEAHTGQAEPADPSGISDIQATNLIEAVALYRGQFMEEYYLDGCPEFEAWLAIEQEMWGQRITKVLDNLIAHFSTLGAYDQAQRFARRWLALEPWREEAHQWLMQLLALTGQRSAALVQYETCRRILADELEVEPTAETVALYHKIKVWADIRDTGRALEHQLLTVRGQPQTLLAAAERHKNQAVEIPAMARRSLGQAGVGPRRSWWLRPLLAGLLVVLLLSLTLTALKIGQPQAPQDQGTAVEPPPEAGEIGPAKSVISQATATPGRPAGRSLSGQLATQAVFYMDKQPDLSLLLSLEASSRATFPQQRSDLFVNLEYSPFLDTFLHSHTGAIFDLSFSPDGQSLASAGADSTIILWDTATRQPLGPPLTGHTAEVTSAAFSPDGRILASASADGLVILWDALTRQPLGPPLSHHPDQIWSLAFSPNGEILASGSADGSIILWDILTRRPLAPTLTGYTAQVTRLVFNPNGQILASAGRDNKVILWDMARRSPLGPPLTAHTDWATDLAFSPDGQVLASAGADNAIILWDVATHKAFEAPLIRPGEAVTSLAFSPDGKTLASGGSSKTITLWDVVTGKPIGMPLKGHPDQITRVTFSPEGKILASSSVDGTIIMWNLAAARFLSAHKADVRWVVFSPDDRILASASADNQIILWDIATGQPLQGPLAGHKDSLLGLAFSPDSQTLASASADGTIILWDVASGEQLGPPLTGHTDWVTDVTFSPDGKTLASSSADHTIILWDTVTHKPLGPPLAGHANWVWRIAFSPDGKILASGGQDNKIILWDVATGQALSPSPLMNHKSWVTSLAFSPDGRTLASGSADTTIKLWDMATHTPLRSPLAGHTGWVWDTLFSPIGNGQSLVSCGNDAKIILWDVATGQPLAPPLLRNTRLESVDLSPDGSLLAVGGFENYVTLWDISYEPWSERACHIANRNLTRAEWNEFIGSNIPYELTCPNLLPG